jgi:hypothetical protein
MMQTQTIWQLVSVSAVSFVLTMAGASSPAQALSIADSVNADKSPTPVFWRATEVGWLYTPSISYSLSGINTKFGAVTDPNLGLPRTVTLEVYDQLPEMGGTLLRSTSFTALLNTFSGGRFSPLNLIAGEDYFIGFRNVAGLGVNETDDADAMSLDLLRFGFDNDGSYSLIDSGINSQPILEFAETPDAIPTPFLLPGLLGLGVKVWRKRRAAIAPNRH